MRALLFLGAVVLTFTGCGESMYYQSRYAPTSVDDAYGWGSRWTWDGDKEVYALPANPPAVDELHRTRQDCQPPGQKFKPATVATVEWSKQATGGGGPEPYPAARLDEPGMVPIRGSLLDHPRFAMERPNPKGAHEPIVATKVGMSENAPQSTPGSGIKQNLTPYAPATYRSDEVIWCLDTPRR